MSSLLSKSLWLRPPRPDDVPALYEAIRESLPETIPWVSWAHANYERSETETFVAQCEAGWQKRDGLCFLALDRGSQRLLGTAGLNRFDPVNRRANLGYWVRTSATGRGVATIATALVARFGLEELGLERIEIVAAVDNARSQRVAERVGATREGVLRRMLRVHDLQHDAVSYSLTRDDLPRLVAWLEAETDETARVSTT